MFGLSRNVLFGIGGVLLAIVLYIGFSSGDEEAEAEEDAKADNGKRKRGKAGRRGRKHADNKKQGRPLCARLHCGEEQEAQVATVLTEFERSATEAQRGIRSANAAIASALGDEEIDDAELGEAFDTLAEHRESRDGAVRVAIAGVHAVLSEVQREKLARHIAKDGPLALLTAEEHSGKGKGKGKRGKGKGKGKRGKGKGGGAQRTDALVGEPGASVPGSIKTRALAEPRDSDGAAPTAILKNGEPEPDPAALERAKAERLPAGE